MGGLDVRLDQQRVFGAGEEVRLGWLAHFGHNGDVDKNICCFEDIPCFFSYLLTHTQDAEFVSSSAIGVYAGCLQDPCQK